MSEGAPSKRLPQQINPRKLAYAGISIEGVVDSVLLDRLVGAADCNGDVKASLAFSISEEGKIVVIGVIEASLVYQCQRCMQAMPAQLQAIDVEVCVVRNEDEAKQLPKSLDPWIVADEEADLHAFIEEELLLAMPVVNYHDYECIDSALLQHGDIVDEHETVKENPFSVLSTLKEKNSDS